MDRIDIKTAGCDIHKTLQSGQIFRFREAKTASGGDIMIIQSLDKVCGIKQYSSTEYTLHCPDGEHTYWENFLCVSEPEPDIGEFMGKTEARREIYEFGKGLRLFKQDPWEMLISFIISQRNNIPRIKRIIECISTTCGTRLGPNLYAFPTPWQLLTVSLKDCGLGYREEYVLSAANEIYHGYMDLEKLRKGSKELIPALHELQRINGVGPKVAQCVALFGLEQTGAFPIDVWIQRAIDDGVISLEEISELGENAGIVQQYIYYYYYMKKRDN